VFQAVLADLERGGKPMVICLDSDCNGLDGGKPLPGIPAGFWFQFCLINSESRPLAVEAPGRPVVALKELQALASGYKFWQNFARRFPQSGGLVCYSQPAFDPARKQLLIYASRASQGQAAISYVYELALNDRQWKILKRHQLKI